MRKGGWVYILTNKNHTVLYTGVTSDLVGRLHDHRTKKYAYSFTARYNVDTLVFYRLYDTIGEAIEEEKRIKAGSRRTKIKRIEACNPAWADLWLSDVCMW